ncbi:MAG: HEPN domain-containing protein [bacterium]|nr:HEPN domain-containing protein [bacterium]
MTKINEQINYWEKSAERNLKTALSLFKTKHYDACLFFCHLTLEKLLKGLVVKQIKKAAPYIHDLERLTLLIKLSFTKDQIENIKIISEFSLAGRYDDEKFAFYKKCTKKYTEKYLNISKELYLWLKEQYQKK